MQNKRPKVLWFTNTPSLAAEILNIPTIGGGWIISLEKKIRDTERIDLAVAFRHGKVDLKKMGSEGISYYAIPTKRAGKVKGLFQRHFNKLDNEQLLEYCLEIIQDYKPDLINIFGTEDGFGLIKNKTKVPVVIHLQGILTVYEKKWFSANLNKRDLITNSGVRNVLSGNSLFHTYTSIRNAARREQDIFKINKYFIGRTDWDRRITNVLAPHSTYYTCDELLREEFYVSTWNKEAAETKIFVSTIQANIYKGLETVLEAAILLKDVDKFDFKWYIVGTPADSFLVKIFEKKIRRKFKDYNIIFLGRVGAKELVDIELAADIFIHPSHIDNSPNSVCEAMLIGMPVIATSTGGTSSLMVDKQEGLLIQDGGPYSMAGAILELVKEPDFSRQLGKHARVRGLKRNNAGSIVLKVIDIYDQILRQ